MKLYKVESIILRRTRGAFKRYHYVACESFEDVAKQYPDAKTIKCKGKIEVLKYE